MLRCVDVAHLSSKLITLSFRSDLIINNASFQCIRWRRKPRWMPIAKSRMFKIPERPKTNEQERVELKRLHDRYKTEMYAIRTYFLQEYKASKVTIQEVKDEEEDHLQSIKINDEWNQKIALIREERRRKVEEVQKERITKAIAAIEEKQKARMVEIDQMVREEKEKSKFYITPENIDKAIDDALASTVDHNYAIDLNGNIFRGRSMKPTDVPPDEMEKIQMPAQS